ncbi:nudC domain-containing protein 1-like [Varroa destructor]|uniref:NudC domain-containing protein 1 n=1 Tax=Varroa destructor TaxID=109461 RepID=A0A7M7JRV6_VARDE|nr:nudC domain-containing protein 1-like [Varroa destructor]
MSSDNPVNCTINELRPNRRFLDPNFDCYRLASDQPQILQHKLKEKIASPAELTTDQFGLCHVELRSKLNALVYDVFHPGSVFYIAQYSLFHVRYENERLSEPNVVLCLSPNNPPVDVDQSESNFLFVNNEFGVILNRQGTIDLLRTEQRQLGKPFTKLLSSETGINEGVLLAAKGRVCLENQCTQVDILICSVKEKKPDESAEYPETVHFLSWLDWLTFERAPVAESESSSTDWQLNRRRKLYGTAVPKSATFLYNSRGSHLLICSECQYKFKYDSKTAVTVSKQVQYTSEKDLTSPVYTYMQNNEDVVVMFRLQPDTSKRDVNVDIKPSSIEIKICGETVLDGVLEAVVDSGASTWSIVDDKLEVTLVKCRAQRWPRVVKGTTKGEEVFDAAYLDEVGIMFYRTPL